MRCNLSPVLLGSVEYRYVFHMMVIAGLGTHCVGNAKILNEDTHDDLLSETNMTSYQYT